MPSLVLVVPGRIETRTGGYGYDRRIAEGLRRAGWDVRIAELDASFPQPTPAAREQAVRALAAIPDGRAVLIDGLALGAMPIEAEREQARLRLLALVHHPLALETGLDAGTAAMLERSERRALAAVRRVVVTSQATAATLGRYGVTASRVVVVEPGTDRAPLAHGSGGPDVHLLCVASVVPRKGHDVLVGALARMPRDAAWRLTLAGSLDRDASAVSRLREMVDAAGLAERVRLAGELDGDRLGAAYDAADAFVLATRYEGYGMAVAEAVARGLPVVSTATGAIEAIVGRGGVIVPPDDERALADALAQVARADVRARLAVRAREQRTRLPGWDDASRRMAEVVSVEFSR
ncbi:MAG TPA: glycosyltransferase family 4 protein [Vicinamibacterales bacterium]|nr:glycosyltransferase family 4 protein [Vicinamibacterales bacterium]